MGAAPDLLEVPLTFENTVSGNWHRHGAFLSVSNSMEFDFYILILGFSTAAIRFHNGSVYNLVKVEGSPEYQHVMKSLAGREQSTKDSTRGPLRLVQAQQTVVSRSTSDCVRIITAALIDLKEAAELHLGQTLPPALPAYPDFPGLQREMIEEAMARAEITVLGDQRVAPVGAAAAANGIGLCGNFTDLEACEAEERQMPMSRVLAVEYTSVSLTVTMSPFQASRKGYDWIIRRDFALGASKLPNFEDSEARYQYWRRIREVIQEIPARQPAERPISHVIVMGESVLDETFLQVMKEALYDVMGPQSSAEQELTSPTFAAARGAAELGKRMMESPDDCVELALCKWWRRYIGGK